MEHFKLIITIVDRGKGGKAVDLYRRHHLHFDFACLGAGTASSKILNYSAWMKPPRSWCGRWPLSAAFPGFCQRPAGF